MKTPPSAPPWAERHDDRIVKRTLEQAAVLKLLDHRVPLADRIVQLIQDWKKRVAAHDADHEDERAFEVQECIHELEELLAPVLPPDSPPPCD